MQRTKSSPLRVFLLLLLVHNQFVLVFAEKIEHFTNDRPANAATSFSINLERIGLHSRAASPVSSFLCWCLIPQYLISPLSQLIRQQLEFTLLAHPLVRMDLL